MDSLKISTRLSLGFFVITFAFLVLSAFTGWRIQQVSQATAQMENEMVLLDLAEKWQADVRQNSARSLAAAYSPGPAMFEFFKTDMAATSAETTVTQKKFLELAKNEASLQRAQAVGDVRKAWLAIREQANALKATSDEAGTQALVHDKLVPATNGAVRSAVCMFYIANEGLSILENAGRIGLPMPEALKGALVKLKDGKNDTADAGHGKPAGHASHSGSSSAIGLSNAAASASEKTVASANRPKPVSLFQNDKPCSGSRVASTKPERPSSAGVSSRPARRMSDVLW